MVEELIIETDDERRSRLNISEPAELLNNHAWQLKEDGKFYAAKIALQRAIALSPECGPLYTHLGAIFWNLGDYEQSYHNLEHANKLTPDEFGVQSNLGSLMASLGRYDESLDYFDKAITIASNNKNLLHARWDRTMMLLDSGQWEQGFADYDVRIKYRGSPTYPIMPCQMWNGEDLNGKAIFVQGEQGLGDRIMLSRYLIWLKGKYPTVRIFYLASSPDLPIMENLMWEFSHFIEFIPSGVPYPKVDYGVFLGSLPRLHGTTVDNVPPDPGLIRMRADYDVQSVTLAEPHVACMKIGVCWTGNQAMHRNNDRSIPLEILLELETLPFVQLYGLQFGEGHKDIERLGAYEILCDLAPDISKNKGLVGTASSMLKMDLIITVDTVTAHLAGALGVPTWVMLCHDPYWVYLREREDSVWYPSMRLFRQDRPNNWRYVIENVKTALHEAFERKNLTSETNKDCLANLREYDTTRRKQAAA